MSFFNDTTDCRPGTLTKATVGKSIEVFLRTIAESQGFDAAENLPVDSIVNISTTRTEDRVGRVRVSWTVELTPPSGEMSEEAYDAAIEALLTDLEGA